MEIRICEAMWGYLYSIFDLGPHPPGMTTEINREGIKHSIRHCRGTRAKPGRKGTYGRYRPWGDHSDSNSWRDETDHYVVLAEGERDGRPVVSKDADASHFYGARIFLWGRDDDHKPISRETILPALRKLVDKNRQFYFRENTWWPCLPHPGYRFGAPTFEEALMADPQYDPGWHVIQNFVIKAAMAQDGYHTDYYEGKPGRSVSIYIDEK